MDCPICGEYGFTYASKPMGGVKFRYRQCTSCDNRFKTYEEIDPNPPVRAYQKLKVVPLKDPADIRCPDCNGETRHQKRRAIASKVVHSFQCKSCARKFAIETDQSDPIAKARSEAAKRARVLCPQCDGRSRCIETRRNKSGTIRRYECQSCGHRFKHTTNPDGSASALPPVKEGEPNHRVMP